jgi:hypothetical protein
MKLGYLILASERRIIATQVDCIADIRNAIGCRTIEGGTTFAYDDHLLVNGDQVDKIPEHWFWVQGVPFPFSDNALLIGVSPLDGSTLEHPVMTIEEFRSAITFAARAEIKRTMMQPEGSR